MHVFSLLERMEIERYLAQTKGRSSSSGTSATSKTTREYIANRSILHHDAWYLQYSHSENAVNEIYTTIYYLRIIILTHF